MKKKITILLSLLIIFFSNVSAQELVPMHNDKGMFGYGIKGEKTFVIKPQWDEARPFNSHGIAIVRKGESFGLIDKNGKPIGKSMGYSVIAPYDNTDMMIVALGGKRVDDPSKIKNRVAVNARGFRGSLSYPIKGAKWGLVRPDGQFQIKPEFEEISDLMADDVIAIMKKGLFGIIGINGNVILKPIYDMMTPFNNQGLAYLHNKKKNKLHLVNKDGKSIIESEDKFVYQFMDNHWGSLNLVTAGKLLEDTSLWNEPGRLMPISLWGSSWVNTNKPYVALFGQVKKKKKIINELSVSDLEGHEVIPASEGFTNIFAPSEGIAVAYKDDQCGFYDINTKTFTPVQKRTYLPFKSGHSLSYDTNSARDFYLVDKNGRQTSGTYDAVTIVNDRYLVTKGSAYGVIDYEGNVIIPLDCMQLQGNDKGVFAVRNNIGAFGWMDSNGKTIIPFDYVDGSLFVNGYAMAAKLINDSTFNGKRCGVINIKNEVVVPFEYKKTVGLFDRQNKLHVWVQKDDNSFYTYNLENGLIGSKEVYTDMTISSYGIVTKDANGLFGLIANGEEIIPCAVENEQTLQNIYNYILQHNMGRISATRARSISIKLLPATNKFKLTDKINDSYWDF